MDNFSASVLRSSEILSRLSNPDFNILLWGFGPNTPKLIDSIKSVLGKSPVGIFDTRLPETPPDEIFGVKTIDVKNITSQFPIDSTIIIITCGLNELFGDIVKNHLFYYHVVHRRSFETAVSVLQNPDALNENLNLFEDDISKQTYLTRINALLDGALINTRFDAIGRPYFNNDIVPTLPKRWFYAGLYDGRHFERAMRTSNFDKDNFLIGCEPSKRMAQVLENKFREIENVHVKNALLWSSNGEQLNYNDDASNNGLAASINVSDESGYKIATRTIDSVLEEYDANIDYISLDTEGSELNVLVGAKTTIEKSHCNLAVCIYHSFEDYVEIPKVLKAIGGKLYVRQHSSIPLIETVAYLIR
jgi:FkbM family methyltransferase